MDSTLETLQYKHTAILTATHTATHTPIHTPTDTFKIDSTPEILDYFLK